MTGAEHNDEPALPAIEQRYRTLLDAIDQGFCIIEVTFDEQERAVDYRFLEVNAAFQRQTGLSDARGRSMRELAPMLEEHWFQIYGHVALSRRPVRFANRAEALNRWYDVYAFPVGEAAQHLVGILFNDISDVRQAETASRVKDEQLRLIFESATEYAIVVSDRERRVVGWNTGAERLLGYSEKEILGQSADIFFTPEDRATHQPEKEIEGAITQGRAVNERWHVRKDGTRFWGSGFLFPSGDEIGPSRLFVKIMRDRTGERHAEEDRRRTQERLRLAIESSELGTWEYNPITRASSLDERAHTIYGLPPGTTPTFDLFIQTVHPDDRARVQDRLLLALSGEDNGRYQDEYRIVRLSDGEQRWVRAAARVHFNADGQPYDVVGAVFDISDLMKAREVLTRRSEELERIVEERTRELRDSVQQLETFSYSVVHDMRAPLRSVRSFAEILNEEYGPGLDDKARDYLRRLHSSVGRMDALITDVLAYSRVNSTEAALTSVNLDELVREIMEQYPHLQEQRARVQVQSPLPSVRGNRALLTQCISNLVANALKFVPPDREPSVIIRAESEDSTVRIWIEDNGIGIAPEHRERIFGLFQRLHSTAQFPGTGVGLAIVKKAAERMRGSVGVESEVGKGSRFWLELNKA